MTSPVSPATTTRSALSPTGGPNWLRGKDMDASLRAVLSGDRALRNPASEKQRAGRLAQGARRQAVRDSKRAAAR